ncbi:YtrH family sporulation protein [Alicyclobacillus dauci]|uniref:YtrH family sporulation protein n=1 Tax=Alicyclobacillus dauci TaxID=1475485 RepID=A0ABY6Z0A7_9BACL|nr:YtrH family sporulation protein [Alicyclobacillus dauci]WAH35796.1 YtrH family sporulation protein [Alicyclobacillus dauci]
MFPGIVANCLLDFFVSMGLVIGGSLLGGFAAVVTHHNPSYTMLVLADDLKIWALVAALGGTMDTLRVIHKGVFSFAVGPMARQFIYLVAAFIGCQIGYMIIEWLVNGSDRHP